MTAKKLLVVALATTLALLVANGLVALDSITTQVKNGHWVAHTHHVLAQLEDVLSTLTDAETGQRGFLLTGRGGFPEPHRQAVARLPGKIDDLEQLTADNSEQGQRIAGLRPLVEDRLALLHQGIVARRAGKGQEALPLLDRG